MTSYEEKLAAVERLTTLSDATPAELAEIDAEAGLLPGCVGQSCLTTMTGRRLTGRRPDPTAVLTGEAVYRDDLARHVDGLIEVTLPFGRADIATPTDVFEVEPAAHWGKGVQQALAYAAQCELRPNIALFGSTTSDARRRMRWRLGELPAPGCVLWLHGQAGWERIAPG